VASLLQSRTILKQLTNTVGYNTILFITTRFVLFYLLGRNLSPAEYGAYNLMASVISLGIYFLGLGLCHYVIKETPGNSTQHGLKLFKSTVSFELLTAGLVIAVLVSTGGYTVLLEKLKVTPYADLFYLALLLMLEELFAIEIGRYLYANKKIEKSNFFDFFKKGLWVYLLGAAWLIGIKPTLLLLLVFRIISVAFSIILALKSIQFKIFSGPRFDFNDVKLAFVFGFPLFVSSLSDQIVTSVDRFILSFYHSPAQVGIYAFADGLVNMAYGLTGAVMISVMFPYMAAEHNNKIFQKRDLFMTYMFKYSLFLTGAALAGLLLTAKPMLTFLARKEYIEGLPLMPVLALGTLLYALSYPANYLLILENKTKQVMLSRLIGMGVYVGLNFLLIPRYAGFGAAVASLVSYAVMGLMLYGLSQGWRHVDFRKLFTFKMEKELLLKLIHEIKRSKGNPSSP